MRKLFIAVSLLGVSLLAQAQKEVANGDKLVSELAYQDALKAYMDADQTDGNVILKIAETQRTLQNYTESEKWFEKAYEYHKKNTVALLHYADVLEINANYDKAKSIYNEVLALDDENKIALNGLKSCDIAAYLEQCEDLFEISTVDFNTAQYDFSPAYYEDGIVFTSDRERVDMRFGKSSWTGNAYEDLYYVEEGSSPKLLKGILNSKYHDGPLCFNADQSVVYFTVNHSKPNSEGVLNLKVMYSKWDASKKQWGSAEELPFNDVNYSIAHPAVSRDGKTLYFVSDMPGGFGGSDIWMSSLKDGSWGSPNNLGAEINTGAEEKFPYVSPDGDLYFASNGHPGLGGLDVFRSYKMDDGYCIWNLGAPLNSSKDDFGLILDGSKNGYVTSARDGGQGFDDIYKVKMIGCFLEVSVVDELTGEPVPNSRVQISTPNGIVAVNTDEHGHGHVPLKASTDYTLGASAEGYNPASKQFTSGNPGDVMDETIYLTKDYGINLAGLVLEKQSGLPLGGATVVVTNNKTGKNDTLTTVDDGLFTVSLAPDVTYDVVAMKEGYKPASLNFNTNGVTEPTEIKQTLILGDGERVYNVAFNNIYFDYDKSSLREVSVDELDKMLQIMERSENLRVEISAHTDSRGSDAYNMNLSDRRANAVVDYLVENGISADRMIAKGYGESRLRNECSDDVECSEEQHQQNRRVEFAVLDENNKVIMKGQN